MLNFGTLATAKAVSTSKSLKPYSINKVKFDGCTIEEIKGTKDPTAVYKTLNIHFKGEMGQYDEKIFFPNEKSAERNTFKNDKGHEYQRPSQWENTQTIIAQLGTVLNPEGFKKMQEISSKFKSFDDVCKVFIKITDPAKGDEVFLKLGGRKNKQGIVYASLPNIVGLNKQGELFVSDNFISKKEEMLSFTPYELTQKNALLSAKPTNMEQIDEETPISVGAEETATSEGDDIDFDKLGDL